MQVTVQHGRCNEPLQRAFTKIRHNEPLCEQPLRLAVAKNRWEVPRLICWARHSTSISAASFIAAAFLLSPHSPLPHPSISDFIISTLLLLLPRLMPSPSLPPPPLSLADPPLDHYPPPPPDRRLGDGSGRPWQARPAAAAPCSWWARAGGGVAGRGQRGAGAIELGPRGSGTPRGRTY